jgi:nucleoside-diphosphate-sugar epimerase
MRVLLLGASGNIGTAVLDRLSDDPEVTSVRAAARRPPGTRSPHGKVRWRHVDLAQDPLEPLVDDVDAVICLAWLIQPSRDPDATWQVNAVGTARLLDAVARSGVTTLVVASSIAAYSPGAGEEVDESWPTHGTSAASYCREKAYVERLLDAFEAREPQRRVVRIRPAFTFQRSAGVEQRRLFLTPFLPNRLVQPQRLPVLPWPRGLTVQVAHAADVAAAVQASLHRPARGAFNVACDGVLDAERAAAFFDAKVVPVPPGLARAGLATAWAGRLTPAEPRLFDALTRLPTMSTAKAKRELGWQPEFSVEQALQSFLSGVREGEGGTTPALDSDTSGPAHLQELRTGVGKRP